MNWWEGLRGRFKVQEPLERHTTYRIGGPARYMIEPQDAHDLKLLLRILRLRRMPFLVLGAGSNVLVHDKGVAAAVIRLSAGAFKKISFNRCIVEAGAGVHLGQLILSCADKGLSGLESLIGIPGTLGGALAMNAGGGPSGRGIGSVVREVTVMTVGGRIRRLKKKDIEFGYRSTSLSGVIILSARLALAKKAKRDIIRDMDRFIFERRLHQDWRPSCGCVFKNPMRVSAGRLIDLCGLKGRRAGGACISSRHANFIVNVKKARACDVLSLMNEVTRQVRRKFGITLEPEVKLWK